MMVTSNGLERVEWELDLLHQKETRGNTQPRQMNEANPAGLPDV